ncbi:MAG TPA: hypothetical protein VFW11_20660 [Cyclobacteriaceae bacterium]|nr:hypothetical protein [Cyclobacteriaceae bacterium]
MGDELAVFGDIGWVVLSVRSLVGEEHQQGRGSLLGEEHQQGPGMQKITFTQAQDFIAMEEKDGIF